jgi:hypothetical protein
MIENSLLGFYGKYDVGFTRGGKNNGDRAKRYFLIQCKFPKTFETNCCLWVTPPLMLHNNFLCL